MSVRVWVRRLLRPWRQDPVERLRRLGMSIGTNFSIQPGVVLDESHAWLISIGNDVTLAPRVVVLAHDASTKRALGYTRIGKVTIGDRVFIGSNAVILPGVCIGSDCIVGAGSVVTSDVGPGQVAVGNPARVMALTHDYLIKRRGQLAEGPRFGHDYTLGGHITDAQKNEMNQCMAQRYGFVE
ncbi:MAG: acyltransferase [Rhizobacter sp.]